MVSVWSCFWPKVQFLLVLPLSLINRFWSVTLGALKKPNYCAARWRSAARGGQQKKMENKHISWLCKLLWRKKWYWKNMCSVLLINHYHRHSAAPENRGTATEIKLRTLLSNEFIFVLIKIRRTSSILPSMLFWAWWKKWCSLFFIPCLAHCPGLSVNTRRTHR